MTTLIAILIFILILFVLVIGHEFGHFLVAKWSKMRVDEFGFGFPPRIAKIFKKGATEYTLNWIPFGGFVKIYGENGEEATATEAERAQSFTRKSKWAQAAVLVAGVVANVIMAWIFISLGLMTGLPTSLEDKLGNYVTDARVTITEVLPNSPAQSAGIEAGDVIDSLTSGKDTLAEADLTPVSFKAFLESHGNEDVAIDITRASQSMTIDVTPKANVVGNEPGIGVSMDLIGKLKLGFFSAFWNGIQMTGAYIINVAGAFIGLIGGLFLGHTATLAEVTGPVGLVGIVGDAYHFGIAYLLSLSALISINLAVINLVPFPALDGGRLLFVAIEAVTRRKINPKVSNIVNTIGFFLLIALMIVVTVRDVIHLF